jgi:hypothetical protein
MLSPNDSCETPICSDRNRESSPSLAAITWSIDGPLGPRPVNMVPVMSPLIEFVWPFPMPLAAALSTPLSTWKSPRKGASGERQGVIAYCDPSSEGIQYRSGMPFPVEPDHEAARNRLRHNFRARRRIGSAVRIEHRNQWRQRQAA